MIKSQSLLMGPLQSERELLVEGLENGYMDNLANGAQIS